MSGKREFGDYQTPLHFAEQVCRYLKDQKHINPTAVVEPTCGVGNFLKSSLLFDAKEYYGIEINANYCESCLQSIKDKRVQIIHSDFFSFSSKSLIKNREQILVIGNPPWVTNSTLSTLGSDNIPVKTNFKRLKGLDALTGASNFDICEYIILQLIHEYRNTNTIIAMLCKTTVARNIFKELNQEQVNFTGCDILEFDATKVFGINASACLFVIQLAENEAVTNICHIYDFENPKHIKSRIRYLDGQISPYLPADLEDFDGVCCFEWRQGIKHDCAKVMELVKNKTQFQNGYEEILDIEPDIVFPLVKSSMFKSPVIHEFTRFVIVTQKKVREETEHLANEIPKTWTYLNKHIETFRNRKSSIYKNAPDFSMFGVGEYSYATYKVGVSGFYKRPLFSLLYSNDGKPVMTDDTSYFICFDTYDMAYVAMLFLNSKQVQHFLQEIAFLDAKRPYTKKVLSRLDFHKIVKVVTFDALIETEKEFHLSQYVTKEQYEKFKYLIADGEMSLF